MTVQDQPDIDLSDPRIQAVIDQEKQELQSAVTKLEANNAKLTDQVKRRNSDFDKVQDRLATLLDRVGGEDGLERLAQEREALADTEEADLYRTNPQKWLDKRTGSMKSSYEKQLEQANKLAEDRGSEAATWQTKYERQALGLKFRDSLEGKGFTEDGKLAAAKLLESDGFTLDHETGEAVKLEDDEIKLGPDAKTPYSIDDRIDEMRDQFPSLFAKSSGGGAGGAWGKKAPKTSKKQLAETPGARVKFISKYGQKAFADLPDK